MKNEIECFRIKDCKEYFENQLDMINLIENTCDEIKKHIKQMSIIIFRMDIKFTNYSIHFNKEEIEKAKEIFTQITQLSDVVENQFVYVIKVKNSIIDIIHIFNLIEEGKEGDCDEIDVNHIILNIHKCLETGIYISTIQKKILQDIKSLEKTLKNNKMYKGRLMAKLSSIF